MSDFFEEHSRFFETSDVGAWPDRLSGRYEAIIEANRDKFRNARVLDLASHDGRWSLAVLDAGASHVTGIEARPALVKAAKENMNYYGITTDRFEFVVADLNQRTISDQKYDIVLCLGYFYHTLQHMNLLQFMRSTDASHFILDGMVEPGSEQVIKVYTEDVSIDAHGTSETGLNEGKVLVGHPSAPLLGMMLAHTGYDCVFYDWEALIIRRNIPCNRAEYHSPDNPVGDYARGARVTCLATRRT